ncbi:Zinc finger BED domain-containing protein RICESLEEPER 2 [Linum grandiflorum]
MDQNGEAAAPEPPIAPLVVDEEVIDRAKLKSVVWKHFKKIKVNNVWKAKCNYCGKLLGGDSCNGTSHLKNHTSNCLHRKIYEGSQKILGPNYLAKGKKDLLASAFDASFSRKELAVAIIMHEYPLLMVDHLYFKRFVCSLQPMSSVPSRNTMKREILGVYESERNKIQKTIDENRGRIAITTDMWTASNQKKGYMAVTAHYIDNSWTLRSHMLMFIYVPAPHSSDRLAAVLVNCMLDWNINTMVSTITLDNCSTNDAMIAKIKKKLVLPYLLREGAFLHIRCSAHILNLIVKDGLDIVKEGIETIRDSVSYWLATPKRLEFFRETCKQLRVPCEKRLVLDCPTRWNLIFLMLAIAIPYKYVFNRLKQRDRQYDCLPSNEHWLFASIVCEKLHCFSLVSDLFSGSKYPTANLFFPHICDLRIKISEWMFDPNEIIQRMAASMWAKFNKYWEVIHQILAVVVVLDPQYKLDIVEYYAEILGLDGSSLNSGRIKSILTDLVMEYHSKAIVNNAGGLGNDMPGSSSAPAHGFDLFVSQRKRSRTSSVTAVLDTYLNEDILPRTSDFDIFMWWKINGPKYPILQEIARDILAVPITSVASESSFSSRGRLLDPNRSRLHESTVEALMCTRTWLQDNGNQFCNVTSIFLY